MGGDQTPPTEGQQPPAAPPPEGDGQEAPAQTVEEVDARWRHRVSQKDKAHAAAEQALRDENDKLMRQLAASRAPSSGQSGGGNGATDADYLREQLAQAQREAEEERAGRAIESRKSKYPALAKQVGDSGSSIFATSDDATLARLNALADDEASGSTFAPTTPRKPAPVAPKSLADMDKNELELALKQSVARGDHNR
jgi:hypothetical protein